MFKQLKLLAACTSLALASLSAHEEQPESLVASGGYSRQGTKPQVAKRSETLLPSLPCPDNWRLSGSFLYLLPTLDDTYFVLNSPVSTSFPNGSRQNNDINFSPAFRVGAEYAMCRNYREVQAFYTYLSTNQSRTVSGNNLWATVGRPDMTGSFENYSGTASSRLSLLYQRFDFNFSQRIVNNEGVYFYLQPGLEFASLRLNEAYQYTITAGSTTGTANQTSKAWGFGPQIGIGIDYNMYQSTFSNSWTQAFSLTALFSSSILVGRSFTQDSNTLDNALILSVSDNRTWRTIPAMHARFGLNYLVLGSKVGISLALGYEFNTYIRGLSRTIYPDDVGDGLNSTNYYNFDIQGMYLTGAISF